MSVSLFRRWRSQKFSDLVGQESVVSTLQNVLGAGDPARAYLFCGPRGTGKTSSARIFAKALNCENGPSAEPCNECSQCRSIAQGNNLDVFEIDAASHTQVDKIRDFIVEKVHFTPVSARYKVYIIDEVHKLSTSSFNALLKTLEEPPSHVVFVLATTHPHEMPSTILSRCQRYDFRPLTAGEAEQHLLMIAREEGIDLEVDAARQLARAADGSLRDALVLFEQANVYSEGRVTRDSVLDLLGGVGYEVMEEMFGDLVSGDAASALQRLDSWIVRGRDLKRLAESFQDHLRMLLLLKVKSEDDSIRHLSSEERSSLDRIVARVSVKAVTRWLRSVGEMLGQLRLGQRARLEWEMLLVELACPQTDPTLEGLESRLERLETNLPGPTGSPIDDSRVTELERQVARLSHALDELDTASPPESIAPPVSAPTPEPPPPPPEPVPIAKPEAPAEPPQAAPPSSPAAVTPTPAEADLESDVVDQWLEMPEVLVTGRVSRSGQTHLLDSVEKEPAPAEESQPLAERPTVKLPPPPEVQPVEQSGSEERKLLADPKEFFRLLMQGVKEQDIRLHAVLADARLAELDQVVFELALPEGYDWHFGKIQEGRSLLESVARSLAPGCDLKLECSIGGEKAAPPRESEHDELVKRASGVFGGSVVVD